MNPVGPAPSADACLIGALLYAPPTHGADVLRLVLDDDIESPAMGVVLGAVRGLVAAGKPADPTLVFDELQRTGQLSELTACALRAATTSGAVAEAARDYGGAVVAQSLRRRIASVGQALAESAQTSAELDLAPLVAQAAVSVSYCAHRLAELRGENL